MSKLVIIDEGNIKHKAIFAFRNRPTIPAVYTYMRMILGYLKRLQVTLDDTIILAEDYGSWRKKIDPTYKAQRAGFRETFEAKEWWSNIYKEFNQFSELLNHYSNWQVIKIYNCESDDVASCAVRYLNNYEEKILISSDRDWEMLCQISNVRIFSPITKKFKEVKNPMQVLLEKIQGDKSDNLLEKPQNEKEFEIRKQIVNLLELPDYVENPIKEKLFNMLPKNLILNKLPFRSIKEEFKKLYNLT